MGGLYVGHAIIGDGPEGPYQSARTTAQIVEALRNGTPSIELNPNTGQKPNQGIPADANTLVVGVWMLQPGEDAIVGQRIRAALTKRPDAQTPVNSSSSSVATFHGRHSRY